MKLFSGVQLSSRELQYGSSVTALAACTVRVKAATKATSIVSNVVRYVCGMVVVVSGQGLQVVRVLDEDFYAQALLGVGNTKQLGHGHLSDQVHRPATFRIQTRQLVPLCMFVANVFHWFRETIAH